MFQLLEFYILDLEQITEQKTEVKISYEGEVKSKSWLRYEL